MHNRHLGIELDISLLAKMLAEKCALRMLKGTANCD
jgi:hypothetical protein